MLGHADVRNNLKQRDMTQEQFQQYVKQIIESISSLSESAGKLGEYNDEMQMISGHLLLLLGAFANDDLLDFTEHCMQFVDRKLSDSPDTAVQDLIKGIGGISLN
jgi:hypothetical protein